MARPLMPNAVAYRQGSAIWAGILGAPQAASTAAFASATENQRRKAALGSRVRVLFA